MKIINKNIIPIIALLISFASLYFSYQSVKISNNANEIAKESNNVSKNELNFSKDVRSQQISSKAYSDIYDDPQNVITIEKIKRNIPINDVDKIIKVIDPLEEVGLSYCQGTAWILHINVYLKNTLSYVCNNSEVTAIFAGKKNGVAMLCSHFFPNSAFAKFIKLDNVSSCQFN